LCGSSHTLWRYFNCSLLDLAPAEEHGPGRPKPRRLCCFLALQSSPWISITRLRRSGRGHTEQLGFSQHWAIHAVRDLAARRAFDDCKSSTYRTQLRPGCKGSQGFKHCSVRGSSKGEGQTGHTMVTYLRLAIAGLSLGCPAPIGDAARCSSNILGREVKEGRY